MSGPTFIEATDFRNTSSVPANNYAPPATMPAQNVLLDYAGYNGVLTDKATAQTAFDALDRHASAHQAGGSDVVQLDTIKEQVVVTHGFSVGNVVYRKPGTPATWDTAKADAVATAEAIGVIESVSGTDSFVVVYNGKITGLSGLTDGAAYFLSAATAGLLTTDEPSTVGYVSKPVLIATSTTTGVVLQHRGMVVGPLVGVSSYVEFTGGDVSITATSEATANTIVTADAITFDGSTQIDIEFFSPKVRPPTTANYSLLLCLYDGSTSIGVLSCVTTDEATNVQEVPVLGRRRITPTNASHTYSVRAYVNGGTGYVRGGAGGTSDYVPGYIRISSAKAAAITGPLPVTHGGTGASTTEAARGNIGLTGEIIIYAGSSAPTGWLFCGGQGVSRTTYATLFGVIGTTYGAGDGSTTFNIPDLRGRAVAGKDDMGGSAANRITNAVCGITGTTLGAVGGDQNLHQHSHLIAAGAAAFASGGAGTVSKVEAGGGTYDTANAGTGASQNVQPSIVLNYLIKY
jgi:microcystin-dependent protein